MKAASKAAPRCCPCRGSVMRNAQEKVLIQPLPARTTFKSSQDLRVGFYAKITRLDTRLRQAHTCTRCHCQRMWPKLVAHVSDSVSHTPLWSLDPPVIIIAQTLSYVGR